MFKIMKRDGSELGVVDAVNYIKLASNGCLILTTEREADGIAFNGEPYNLVGKSKIQDKEEVLVIEMSTMEVLAEKISPDIDALYAIMSDLLFADDMLVEEVVVEDTTTTEETGSTEQAVGESTDTTGSSAEGGAAVDETTSAETPVEEPATETTEAPTV